MLALSTCGRFIMEFEEEEGMAEYTAAAAAADGAAGAEGGAAERAPGACADAFAGTGAAKPPPPPPLDVVLELPELDGLTLRASLPFSLSNLHAPTPELRLGGVLFLGQHELAIGTVLAARAPPADSEGCDAGRGLVELPALTSKKVVFLRASGDLTSILTEGVGDAPEVSGGGGGKKKGGGGREKEEEEEEAEEEEEEEEEE